MLQLTSVGSGRRRRAAVRVFLLSSALLVASSLNPLWSQSARPVVYSATVDALIHPVSAEFMVDTMDRADRDGAALVVFTLRTPGGLLDSTYTICLLYTSDAADDLLCVD